MRIVYAGDREISVKILKFIIEQGVRPLALIVPDRKNSSHAEELITLCSFLDNTRIFTGPRLDNKKLITFLKGLHLDYIICVHFPYIIPSDMLEIPKLGVLNLHPAYLPYNRGWHTPTWAIHSGTPYGATLHFMSEAVDGGDIIHQKSLHVLPEDTAHTLYQRVLDVEIEVFKEAWPSLVSGSYVRNSQPENVGTFHKKRDIKSLQELHLEEKIPAGDLITRLRALTTNNIDEAAYFKIDQEKYRVQISIRKEKGER